MKLHPLPAFQDNYIWLMETAGGSDDAPAPPAALVVDPGDAAPVLAWLARAAQGSGVRLDTILVTHHHLDHTGGVAALQAATGARVVAPAGEPPVPGLHAGAETVRGGDIVQALGLSWRVLPVPGHTAGHVAYFCEAPGPGQSPVLFCGDTLFSAGCGRLFEGTPTQMLASLDRLASLPADTRVCCAHEYTLSNLKFAQAVEPHNPDIARHRADCEALRAIGQPTLPSRIDLEQRINPFLRTRQTNVRQKAQAARGAQADDPVSVLAALRAWKNEF
jgi:hydroxyacylglutathione hydrolase